MPLGNGTWNAQVVIDFISNFHPNGPWAVVSILDGEIASCNNQNEAEAFIAEANGHKNLYFNHNVVRRGLGKKKHTKREDIIAAAAVHVDIDPREGVSADELPSEQQRLLGTLLGFPVPPSVVVFSGGGYNAYWLLKEPVLLNGKESIERVEVINRKFERWFGSEDNCSDVSRILRLPGTLNVLNEKKRKSGRQPAATKVVKADWDLKYGLEELEKVPELPSLAKWWLGPLLVFGERPGKSYPSRSEAVWAAVCELIRSGASDQLASWLILNKDLAVSAHVYEQNDPTGYVARQIAKARKEVVVGQEYRIGDMVWKELKPRDDYRLGDFQAYMPRVSFIYMPNSEFWSSDGINGVVSSIGLFDLDGKAVTSGGKPITLPASEWLKRNRPVAQVTWAPGEGVVIEGRLMNEGGWIEQPNVRIFNQYLPPKVHLGNASAARRWVDLVHELYPDIAELFIQCCAQRRQRPQEKINFMILLIGGQRIGKDTILDPVRHAVGPWNCKVISPNNLTDTFNPWKKSVILNINEAHDDEGSGGFNTVNRRQVYESLKPLSAAPPDTLYVNEKNRQQYYVPNVLFPVITSNYPLGAIYLPKDDQRALVGFSPKVEGWKGQDYFPEFYRWLTAGGGYGDVAAYLAELDVSAVNFKAPPPKTEAWRTIVNASLAAASGELGDMLELMQWPDVITPELVRIIHSAKGEQYGDLASLFNSPAKTAKILPYRFNDLGYFNVSNVDRSDGRWMMDGMRKNIFAKQTLDPEVARRKARQLADMGLTMAMGLMWDRVNESLKGHDAS